MLYELKKKENCYARASERMQDFATAVLSALAARARDCCPVGQRAFRRNPAQQEPTMHFPKEKGRRQLTRHHPLKLGR